MGKKKPFSQISWLIPQLRRISSMWPEKNVAVSKAREKVVIGFYKNGNPEYKTMFRCYLCKELFDRVEIQVDHIIPVSSIDGFKDWNTYIDRLFCSAENLAVCCKNCHYLKSQQENEERKKNKKR